MSEGKSKDRKKKTKVKEPQASFADKTVYKALGLSGGIFLLNQHLKRIRGGWR